MFTSRAAKWRGSTTPCTVRLPDPVVEFIDAHLDTKNLRNRSEFLQHWATVGTMVMSNPELREALDWALDQVEPPVPSILDEPVVEEVVVEYAEDPAQEVTDWKSHYGEVTITGRMLTDGPSQADAEREALTHHYEPPAITAEDMVDAMTVPEGSVVVLGPEGGKVMTPADALAQTYDDILTQLRSKVR